MTQQVEVVATGKRRPTKPEPDPTTAESRIDDADKPQPKPRKAPARPSPSKVDAATRVRKALADNPTGTQREIARAAGTSDRTVRRVLASAGADIDALAVAVS